MKTLRNFSFNLIKVYMSDFSTSSICKFLLIMFAAISNFGTFVYFLYIEYIARYLHGLRNFTYE